MPDVKYNDDIIVQTLENETKKQLGSEGWQELIQGLELPNIDMPQDEASALTRKLIQRFDSLVDSETARRILTSVKHGLTPESFPGLRGKFLKYGKIDAFAAAIHQELLDEITSHRDAGKPWYGQVIDDSVVELVQNQPYICYGARVGSTIRSIAIPYKTRDYLRETDERRKRYLACHCTFARASIMQDEGEVSKTLCYCSMGHTKIFWEVALDTPLEGEVVQSVLGGDLACEFVLHLPDAVMKCYV